MFKLFKDSNAPVTLTTGEKREQDILLQRLSSGLNDDEVAQLEREIKARAATLYDTERKLWDAIATDNVKIKVCLASGTTFSSKGQNWKKN